MGTSISISFIFQDNALAFIIGLLWTWQHNLKNVCSMEKGHDRYINLVQIYSLSYHAVFPRYK